MPASAARCILTAKASANLAFQQRLKKGLALVPEDRQGEGVVQMMSIQGQHDAL
ncbi:sugar ABC transporter ATP-binding protein [Klebsiella pneumoniae]|uniref:Sugar ABC transporter ATP-binding protein n=1 Tax=Klebsiella pneumoniae TaxID=573 RepID=A0A378F9F4_KLEPN|nr:sugar ABC transporter ATP-binding protein [Klebsiella pneumoniae]